MLKRTERRDAAEHRRIILQKAEELFMKCGVNQVSMHQIAKSAGVGQGTLYRRYSNKSDLCLDLVLESYKSLHAKFEQFLKESNEMLAEERLERIITEWVDFVEVTNEWMGTTRDLNYTEGVNFFASPIYTTMHTTICELLEELRQQKGLEARDHAFIADSIINATGPSMFQLYRGERKYTAAQYKQSLIQLVRMCT
ncbi:TetR/AcrR family transcriptional regulator [Paenibacillus sp. KN14-4R]|uniref:TetR/AcrR family transcriptional regulator n=1 Tax=Paenibacillus sp. KN14-4R TaxID=3445773 RepID=UPI003F9F7F1E